MKWRKIMSLDAVLQQAGIPLIVFLVCVYYGIRLLLLHDINSIRNKNKPPVKDEKAYAKMSGILLLFLAALTLLMAVLLFISTYAAVVEILIGTIIFGILWKRMNIRYGS
jgi:uncharacterized protein involved in cysteine biosynthesis